MTTEHLSNEHFYRLMTWLSPGFPVGAYAYSHGIEYAVEDGRVTDEQSLRSWIEGILLFGAGAVDGPLFAAAWGAENDDALLEIAGLAQCYRTTSEMALESAAQGKAFLATVQETWPSAAFAHHSSILCTDDRPVAYAVAVAVAAADAGIPLRPALIAFFHAFAANLTSAGVRLIPLGQVGGQRIIENLRRPVADAVEAAMHTPLEDIGSAGTLIDWTSMAHETQYTRLFRS
ncbi:MAG: urease accessory UreF family protein [Pseudomonadota bacterium]|nr:urease accessory UreF family protein [Pseudomonadota bacterium]